MQPAFLSIPYRRSYCMPANVLARCWEKTFFLSTAGRARNLGQVLDEINITIIDFWLTRAMRAS